MNARAEITPATEVVQQNSVSGPATESIVDGDIAASPAPMPRPPLRPPTVRRAIYSSAIGLAEATPAVGAGSRHRPQPASARQAARSTTRSVRTLLIALAGALALVVGASAVVTKFGGKAIGRNRRRGRERMIWTAQPSGEPASPVPTPPPARNGDELPLDWVRSARQAQEANRQAEQIEQLLSRAARRSA